MQENVDELTSTRESLLGRLKNWEDQKSWKEFFDRYWRLIYSVAIKAGLTDAEAQDAVQETVISVAKTMPDFKYEPERCSFKGWLQHLAGKRIADQFRRRSREVLAAGPPPEDGSETERIERIPDPASLNVDALWEQEWESFLISNALQNLQLQVTAQQYQVFYLHTIQQMSAKDVANAVGVSAAQVYLIKHRLKRLFKRAVTTAEKRFT
jgi:RNA polymerase sigma-70 factor (ECF subfamily)